MSRLVVVNNVTLDGVMQAPGRPDEDVRGDAAESVGSLKQRPERLSPSWVAESSCEPSPSTASSTSTS
jgi:hypothetical protein